MDKRYWVLPNEKRDTSINHPTPLGTGVKIIAQNYFRIFGPIKTFIKIFLTLFSLSSTSCGSKGIGFGPEELLDLKIQEKGKSMKLRL